MSAATIYHIDRPRLSRPGLAVVVVLHGAAWWALAQSERITLPTPDAILAVSLLPVAAPKPTEPEAQPPRPKPVAKAPPLPLPLPLPLALPETAPVVPAAVVPAPPVETAAPVPLPPVGPAPVSVPTPIPPRFDADYLDSPAPVYPPVSRRLGEAGRVVLRVQVAPNGLPTTVTLQSSSGSARLDQAALDTVRRWKFVPARLGNELIAAAVLVPIVFSLKD